MFHEGGEQPVMLLLPYVVVPLSLADDYNQYSTPATMQD